MTAPDALSRSDRELRTARELLSSNPDAACSRAYYAMFYAAQAALTHVGQAERAVGKTHSGLIAAFGEYLVRPGLIEAAQGRAFRRVEQRRLLADYAGDDIPPTVAAEVLIEATAFVEAVRGFLADGPSRG